MSTNVVICYSLLLHCTGNTKSLGAMDKVTYGVGRNITISDPMINGPGSAVQRNCMPMSVTPGCRNKGPYESEST